MGRSLHDLTTVERARLRAVLPQHTVLAFAFRCLDVVLMGRYAAISGDDEAVVERVMTATDTEDLADRLYPTLSGGEQTRVSLARVLAQDTPVLFLDEPTASLDPVSSSAFKDLVRARAGGGAAVLLTSHVMAEVEELADDLVYFVEGRVRFHGTLDELRLRTGERRVERAVARLIQEAA